MSEGQALQFEPIALPGAWVVHVEPREDERGSFARTWCRSEFDAHGLMSTLAQVNTAHTRRANTIRGMHYQTDPHEEAKLVRCIRGAIWDVIIDLRPDSQSYLRWAGVNLTAENRRQLYVPTGCAHGYQTLVDDTEVVYLVSQAYVPAAERGVRWNDPQFSIEWRDCSAPEVSLKDSAWPDFKGGGARSSVPRP